MATKSLSIDSSKLSKGDWHEVATGNNLENFANHVRAQYAVWLYLTMQIGEQYLVEIFNDVSKSIGEVPYDFGTWLCFVKKQVQAGHCHMVYAPDLYWLLEKNSFFEMQLGASKTSLARKDVLITYLFYLFEFLEQYVAVMPDYYAQRIKKIMRMKKDASCTEREATPLIRDLITINYHAMRILLDVLNFYPQKIKNENTEHFFENRLVRCPRCNVYRPTLSAQQIQSLFSKFFFNQAEDFFDYFKCNRQTAENERWFKLWRRELLLGNYLHNNFSTLNCRKLYQAFELLKAVAVTPEDKYNNVLNLYESEDEVIVVDSEGDSAMEGIIITNGN